MKKSINKIFRCVFLPLVFGATFTFHFVDNRYAKDLQDWESAAHLKFDYWVKTHSLPMDHLKRIMIDDAFFEEGEIYKFSEMGNIYGLAVSGTIELYSETSLVRLIMLEDNLREYLVYEAYPLIVDKKYFTFKNVCEETCILESAKPYSLRLDLVDASLKIDEVSFVDSPSVVKRDIKFLLKKIKKDQSAAKIGKIKDNIKGKKLKWIVGETSISELTYDEKRKLFGGGTVPNLQGAEYYKGGIFVIKSGTEESYSSGNRSSSLVECFDWRNRHGANDPGSPYYDGDSSGSGWITSVTSQMCYDDWAHSAVGASEALANLYFNQHLDVNFGLNLSVQDVVSCSGGGNCASGGEPGTALWFIANTGVVDEDCFPYLGGDVPCSDKCNDPDQIVHIAGRNYISSAQGEENIKQNLIDYGPLNFGIASWWHSMVLVGYDKDQADGQTIWILKNSWGTGWGENGYAALKVPLYDMYRMYSLLTPVTSDILSFETVCIDSDGDGYYNWGISQIKPSSCPEDSGLEKDCDDSNPALGPFGSDGQCLTIIDPCECDFAPSDGDVDGSDLAAYLANPSGISLEDLAADFGRINCP